MSSSRIDSIKQSSQRRDALIILPIDTTLALQMPAARNSDAKVSGCPTISKLSPDSPDAKIFKDLSGGDSLKAAMPAFDSSTAGSTFGSSESTQASDKGFSSKFSSNNSAGRSESFIVVVLMVSVAVIFM